MATMLQPIDSRVNKTEKAKSLAFTAAMNQRRTAIKGVPSPNAAIESVKVAYEKAAYGTMPH